MKHSSPLEIITTVYQPITNTLQITQLKGFHIHGSPPLVHEPDKTTAIHKHTKAPMSYLLNFTALFNGLMTMENTNMHACYFIAFLNTV
jgi:hypothetical protein